MKTKKKTILIVEDDENIARAEELILQGDYIIHCAKDGAEGFEKAIKLKPHLIILDLMLPKIGGIEMCKKIKQENSLKNTKVVMVTAKNQPSDELKGFDTGADDYIIKPFEPDELKHVISQVLSK